jgi:hypothetical protein
MKQEIFFDKAGKKYVKTGEHRFPKQREYFLENDFTVQVASVDFSIIRCFICIPYEEPKAPFAGVKVGDRVFHYASGWTTVSIVTPEAFYTAPRRGKSLSGPYTLYGKVKESDPNPVVFWDEVKVTPPERPKRKVMKTVKQYGHIVKDGSVVTYISKEAAGIWTKEPLLFTISYEVEEE